MCAPGTLSAPLLLHARIPSSSTTLTLRLLWFPATFLQILLQVAAAVFGTWFLVQLKNILVRDLLLPDAVRSGHTELERIYLPLSSLVTWAAGLGCALAVCGSLGLRLEPLLAVGGAGGIAAGFASQQVLTNMVSGEGRGAGQQSGAASAVCFCVGGQQTLALHCCVVGVPSTHSLKTEAHHDHQPICSTRHTVKHAYCGTAADADACI
jgi:hypothetical protein